MDASTLELLLFILVKVFSYKENSKTMKAINCGKNSEFRIASINKTIGCHLGVLIYISVPAHLFRIKQGIMQNKKR